MTATQLKATTRFVWGPDKDAGRDAEAYAMAAATLCGRICWSLDTLFGSAIIDDFHAERTVLFDDAGHVPEAERQRCLVEGLAVLAKAQQAELVQRLALVDPQIDGWHEPIMAGKDKPHPEIGYHGLADQDREWVYKYVGGVIICGHPYGLLVNGLPVLLNMPEEPLDSVVRLYVEVAYEVPRYLLPGPGGA